VKNLIVIILLILNVSTYAQDIERSPIKFDYKIGINNYINKPLMPERFPQNQFMISTQWGGHPRMLQALKFNCTQDWRPNWGISPDTIQDPNYKIFYIWDNRYWEGAAGFQFNPTLYIPPDQRGKFISKPKDTTRSIFGFSYIKGTILDSNQSNNENYDRLILNKNDTSLFSSDSIILKYSWINNMYFYFAGDTNIATNGTRWLISINLRRLDTNEVCNNNFLNQSKKYLAFIKNITDITFNY
jgi:hypothetical protein